MARCYLSLALAFGLATYCVAEETNKSPAIVPSKLIVTSAKAVGLKDNPEWSKLPAALSDAQIFAAEPKGGDVEFEVLSDGIVIIAASWTYDGNESGGWYETRVTQEQMREKGWKQFGEIAWKEKDLHQLYWRPSNKGEKVKFHTRKYNQPFVIVPEPTQLAAVGDLFKANEAVPKVVPAAGTDPSLLAKRPTRGPGEPALADVEVRSAKPVPLDGHKDWTKVPEFLRGAWIFTETPAGGDLEFEAKQMAL